MTEKTTQLAGCLSHLTAELGTTSDDNKCPKCGARLQNTKAASICENYQHPNIATCFAKNGLRICDYGVLGG